MIPIERTHEYRGRYHVLGGALSPIDGVEPEDLRIAQLYARIAGAETPVREVVLATNPTTTGEATALHVAAALHERAPDVAVTRLASGLPVGGDLEYADEVTLGRAFAGRRAVWARERQRRWVGRWGCGPGWRSPRAPATPSRSLVLSRSHRYLVRAPATPSRSLVLSTSHRYRVPAAGRASRAASVPTGAVAAETRQRTRATARASARSWRRTAALARL